MKFDKPQILVAQMGAGMQAQFFTDAYVGPGNSWEFLTRLAPLFSEAWQPAPLRRLLSRYEEDLPADKVTAFNLLGFFYALAVGRAGGAQKLDNVHLEYGRNWWKNYLNLGLSPKNFNR